MEKAEYRNLYQKEASHFYYLANHRLIISLAAYYFKNENDLKILDAGCGTGLLAKKLEKFGDVVGVDYQSEALKFARMRKVKVIYASITNLPFKNNTFDLITCIDVIYHQSIKDDSLAISELYRVLKKNGLLIIRVPAVKWLIRSSDQFVMTRQRYSLLELITKLKKAQFSIQKATYINLILLAPAIFSFFIEKIVKPQKTTSPLVNLPKLLNIILALILKVENFLIFKFNLPIGLGILAVAKKR